jgi:hypothetical protein
VTFKQMTTGMLIAILLLTGAGSTFAYSSNAARSTQAAFRSSPADTPSPSPTDCLFSYTDVPPDYWAYHYIAYLTCNSAISGYPDGSFQPGANMQRDQFARVIVKAKQWQIQHLSQIFSDVPSTYWAYNYVETSYAFDAVTGYHDSSQSTPCADHQVATPCYLPHNNITRAELISVVVRVQGWAPYNPPTPDFSDVPTTHWAYPFIETGYLHGIISGYADHSFRPNNNITRAEVCKVVTLAVSGGL